jgi:hypothetical protein
MVLPGIDFGGYGIAVSTNGSQMDYSERQVLLLVPPHLPFVGAGIN